MANINSISGNSTSGTNLYGTRNVLTGLASGMDTETLIQNSITGYQTKLTSLRQDQEKIEWKQEAYRGLTDQMYNITQKYTSYTSKTNLSSNTFFNSASTTTAQGANAAAVTATGRTKSDVQINSVTKLATAARYSVGVGALNFSNATNLKGSAVSAAETKKVSAIEGSLTLTAGTEKITLDFGVNDVYEDADALVESINSKLSEQKAKVKASIDGDGKITFKSTSDKGESVYLSGATGNFKSKLGVECASSSAAPNRFTFNSINVKDKPLTEDKTMAEFLSGRTIEVTLDGTTKKISVGELTEPDMSSYDADIEEKKNAMDAIPDEDGEAKYAAGVAYKAALQAKTDAYRADLANQIKTNLQTNLNRAFGNGAVTVDTENGALKFDVKQSAGSSLKVTSEVKELGLSGGISNYFDTGNKLESLLGKEYFRVRVDEHPTQDENGDYHDAAGNRTNAQGYLLDEDGGFVYEEKELVINGVKVGSFGADAKLEQVMSAINTSADAGVNVSFSRLTGEFVFNSNSTGENEKIEFGDGLANRLFYSDSAQKRDGTDAELTATVNGTELTLKRASNVVDMDGMVVTLKNTFTEGEAVSFKTTADSDKIVDTIKTFVDDVNKLMKDIHDAYATMPAEKSGKSHARYEPLTEDDKKDMSESTIKAYEEKAKQGILFGDNDLSSLYNKLRSVIEPSGKTRINLESIGISTTYSGGVTSISINEEKLRAALDSDPEKVRTAFATTQDSNGNTDGLMERLKKTMNTYASTSIATPGVLVRKAGSKFSATSLLNNTLQKQIDNLNTQIESWETKLSSKIDYYTKQFTALEKMISTMNNQSSMLADLAGY